MMKMAQVLVARLAARIGRLAMVKAMGMLFTMVDFSLTYKYSNTNTQIHKYKYTNTKGMLSVNSGGLLAHQAEVKVGTNQHSLSPKLHTLKRGMRRDEER